MLTTICWLPRRELPDIFNAGSCFQCHARQQYILSSSIWTGVFWLCPTKWEHSQTPTCNCLLLDMLPVVGGYVFEACRCEEATIHHLVDGCHLALPLEMTRTNPPKKTNMSFIIGHTCPEIQGGWLKHAFDRTKLA